MQDPKQKNFAIFLFVPKKFDGQEKCTYCNATVSHIECGPMIASQKKIHEVHYIAEPDPVDEVPGSPTKDQGRTPQGQPVSLACPEQIDNSPQGKETDHLKKQVSPFLLACQEPKGCTSISHIGHIEKTRNNIQAFVKGKIGQYQIFGDLIKDKHKDSNGEKGSEPTPEITICWILFNQGFFVPPVSCGNKTGQDLSFSLLRRL